MWLSHDHSQIETDLRIGYKYNSPQFHWPILIADITVTAKCVLNCHLNRRFSENKTRSKQEYTFIIKKKYWLILTIHYIDRQLNVKICRLVEVHAICINYDVILSRDLTANKNKYNLILSDIWQLLRAYRYVTNQSVSWLFLIAYKILQLLVT